MLGCLFGLALLSALLGVAVLIVRPPRAYTLRQRPSRVVRGCIALPFLLVTLGLLGMMLVLRYGGQ